MSLLRYVFRAWSPIIILCVLVYAVWGDHGQKGEIYTKGGVSITLVLDDSSMEVIGEALGQDRWIFNGRCSIGNCLQFSVTLDERSGVYRILDARESVVGYYSDPEEVYWEIKHIQADLGDRKRISM